ncbi:RBPJ-interacting and tubulin-associated protein 1 [Hyla sarda]|uniref:RBPJ-interacting and tubulin-associated protein 1 n=1 Tax=Hyla sarda TaxID=327740 RepID=UPI0024C32B00|nr:RBPJ-interacting and tubulin-associated protein 1 [Hyla sarda]XP_056384728.1 RBPJ-interacting and tubulin-associated protein 1 [Hyla sarda]XP_056384729.1 RBPJ-interacting and tubulin-associated protein 1 [Hyla sarda]XP_056384730.1 RBPJ-interacting and tubulin-associated protein 1 [Hyla sarda]XP_056384731.1 RBPJ-interacting and tubulin-associated protein 1 [Hyla sarda]XP_056384732.1 RBPJ-interacting and tubulin-associated protein 1 [Hyla sarda]
MSLDLSITGQRTTLPPRKSRSAYRFKSSNSFVDETLFGSSLGKVDPALQWTVGAPVQESSRCPEENKNTVGSTSARAACTSVGTPRKKSQFRVKSRSASYCDESLFGPKVEDCGWEAPWVKKEDSVRIRPLLWSPPPIMRPQSSKTNANRIPVRAIHPPNDRNGALGMHKGNFWKPPESDSDSGGCPSVGDPPASAKPYWNSPTKETARSASCSGRLTARRGSLTDRPPWK